MNQPLFGLDGFLAVGALLFIMGLFTVFMKRTAIMILMGIELMLNAVNLNFVAFSAYFPSVNLHGQIFSLFVITIAAAEAAIGLGIVLALKRNRSTILVEDIDLLKQ